MNKSLIRELYIPSPVLRIHGQIWIWTRSFDLQDHTLYRQTGQREYSSIKYWIHYMIQSKSHIEKKKSDAKSLHYSCNLTTNKLLFKNNLCTTAYIYEYYTILPRETVN